MSDLHEIGFSGNTYPNLFTAPEFGTEYLAARKAAVPPAKDVYPARDDRYPAYAGPMADGRLVTDYRPHCSKNIRPAEQYYTKLWMIHHTDEMMDESRRRQGARLAIRVHAGLLLGGTLGRPHTEGIMRKVVSLWLTPACRE